MLFGFEGRRQIRVPSISTSRFNLQAARFLDLVARFYGGEQAGDFVVNRLPLPIGMTTAGKQTDRSPMLDAALLKTAADGKPVYPRTLPALNDTAEPVALIRNALSAQVDQNAVVVLAGPPDQSAGDHSPTGRPRLGDQKGARAEYRRGTLRRRARRSDRSARDVAGFRKLLAEWPSPIVMAGTELSEALPFPGTSLESGAAWAPHHPIVDAYRAFRPMPYDAPSRTLAAVLHAVEPGPALLRPVAAGNDHGGATMGGRCSRRRQPGGTDT